MKTFSRFATPLIILIIAVQLLHGVERFDLSVRGDFFSGFAGNKEALTRAMQKCEEVLRDNPTHAEAMVWHGSGNVFIAGGALQQGDFQAGMTQWLAGMREMDEAVALAPESVAVRIPRGATLLVASERMPKTRSKEFLEKGVGDYEEVRKIQTAYFDKLSGHSRGELLFGLADGYARLEKKAEAREAFEALLAVGKASGHENQAKQWLAGGSYEKTAASCTGCHTSK